MIEEFAVPSWVRLMTRLARRQIARSTGWRPQPTMNVATPTPVLPDVSASVYSPPTAEPTAADLHVAELVPTVTAVEAPEPTPADAITQSFLEATRAMTARVQGLVVVPPGVTWPGAASSMEVPAAEVSVDATPITPTAADEPPAPLAPPAGLAEAAAAVVALTAAGPMMEPAAPIQAIFIMPEPATSAPASAAPAGEAELASFMQSDTDTPIDDAEPADIRVDAPASPPAVEPSLAEAVSEPPATAAEPPAEGIVVSPLIAIETVRPAHESVEPGFEGNQNAEAAAAEPLAAATDGQAPPTAVALPPEPAMETIADASPEPVAEPVPEPEPAESIETTAAVAAKTAKSAASTVLAPAVRDEYNRTNIDYRRPMPRPKARGRVIDFHCHLLARRHADDWFEAADHYGMDCFVTMSPLEEAVGLARQWGHRLRFNAVPQWGDASSAWVDNWLRRIEGFYNLGSRMAKFHASPGTMLMRGHRLDSPVYEPLLAEVKARGMAIMTHIGDPDTWYAKQYADTAKFGAREDHYRMWESLLEAHRGTPWVGAHLGGNPEDLPRLQRLLDKFPDLMLDCSATRWMVREISARRDPAREFFIRNQDRILFGSDQVSGDDRQFDFLASRIWSHRKLWETAMIGPSPIFDPDLPPEAQPTIRGLALPDVVLQKIYHDNATGLLNRIGMGFD